MMFPGSSRSALLRGPAHTAAAELHSAAALREPAAAELALPPALRVCLLLRCYCLIVAQALFSRHR